jgi:hypothetical protein
MPFSLPSMARGFGALLVITTVSEIAASRSDFEEQDFTWLIARNRVLIEPFLPHVREVSRNPRRNSLRELEARLAREARVRPSDV